jgi:hypothetical protein
MLFYILQTKITLTKVAYYLKIYCIYHFRTLHQVMLLLLPPVEHVHASSMLLLLTVEN